MDAVEFLKEWDRMCKSNEKCKECDGYKLCTSEEGICSNCEELVKAVENWAKTHPVIILTEQQKTAIRGRIAEGYKWVVGWQFSNVVFSVEKPEQNENGGIGLRGRISYGDFLFFNFAKGNSIFYLPDLLGGEE
ncbi:hypothetical protein [Anaerotignum lactatifermentans]|uniref:hypothetical protein n=1 Tax=Anaerotignum lactatifermentans TaxID=160404 RepID=UPI002674B160|nr:hypothetical protein [Anaerotignum lactatifermentans]